MPDYQFNEKGMCKNPSTETLYNDGQHVAIIGYAEKGSKWTAGYNFIHPAERGFSMPQFVPGRMEYDSMNEARTAAIIILVDIFKHAGTVDSLQVADKLKNDIRNA